MHLSKDEQILYHHFEDMYNAVYKRGIPLFSDFMGLNEMGLLYRFLEDKHIPSELIKKYVMMYGGYAQAERQMICFLPDESYQSIEEKDFPIVCIKIAPVNKKFCDKLSHRDFLGTVMSLGLERDQIGDIVVEVEGSDKNTSYAGYVFCQKNKSSLLKDITRIRHTTVSAEVVDGASLSLNREYREIYGSVPSFRLDAIIAVAVKSSRSGCLELIKEGCVYLNGRCCTENSKSVSDGDIITVRGHGKFLIEASQTLTKKGRYHITVKQYI